MLTLRRKLFPAKKVRNDEDFQAENDLSVGGVIVPPGDITLVSESGNQITNHNSTSSTTNFNIKKVVIEVKSSPASRSNGISQEPVLGGGPETDEIEEQDGKDILSALKPLGKSNHLRPRGEDSARQPRLSADSDVWSTRTSIRSGQKTPTKRQVVVPPAHCVQVTIKNIQLPEDLHEDIKAYMCSSRFSDTPDLFLQSPATICLWNPFYNISMDRKLQESHCILGDIGMFNSDGGFDVFFNMFMTMEENLAMDYDPPNTFVPLELTSRSSINAQKPTPQGEGFYLSNNFKVDKEIGESIYTFESIKAPQKPGGAILVLPEGCIKQFITRIVKDKIEDYLAIHAESWYDPENYSNKLRALPNGSLQLIRACYRSNSWAAAVLPTRRYNPGMSYARLKRSVTNPRHYDWDDSYRKSIIVSTGSSKKDVQDLQRTIAVEVYSIYHYGPQIELISSRTSISSRRSTFAQSFSTITNFLRRPES